MKIKATLTALVLTLTSGIAFAENNLNQISNNSINTKSNITELANADETKMLYSRSAKWMEDFDFDYYRVEFTNISGECRYLIVRVTTSNGYNQLYHHRSQPWDSFGLPHYNDGSMTITKRAIASLSCNKTPPGIAW